MFVFCAQRYCHQCKQLLNNTLADLRLPRSYFDSVFMSTWTSVVALFCSFLSYCNINTFFRSSRFVGCSLENCSLDSSV